MQDIEIKITSDGSATLYVPALDEHYHSVNGAIQESEHVFIEAGLKQIKKENLSVLEIGFGTGLNAFLTIIEGQKLNKTVSYSALELYPVSETIIKNLNYPGLISGENQKLFSLLHTAAWNEPVPVTPFFCIEKEAD